MMYVYCVYGEKHVWTACDSCEIEMGAKHRIYGVKSWNRSKVQTLKKQESSDIIATNVKGLHKATNKQTNTHAWNKHTDEFELAAETMMKNVVQCDSFTLSN